MMALAPAAAHARVIQAEAVLPPGQSGHVSITGVAQGTGSPHLSDQTGLFTSFGFRSALFNQPGDTDRPRDGVSIVRDGYGVPAVTGATDYDAWWGVGYAVAQDRLFQLEAFKRATSGRLAEMLGSDSLEDDVIARRDYYTDAELQAQLDRLPATLLRRAEAYRDGINAHIAHVRANSLEMPGEFVALAIPLEDWTLLDTARVGVFLARTVPSGDGEELNNARALIRLGARAFQKLLPLRTPGRIATVPRRSGLFPSQPGRTRKQEKRAFRRSRRYVAGLTLPETDGGGQEGAVGGSYMWGIRAARPRGRKRRRGPGPAYLFNGPQLGYSVPELFVEFELHSPVQDVRGVSAAGVPVVGIGHNGHVAWGFTSGLSDEDDLYAEKLTGEETYEFQGRQRQMDCRSEVFDYRAAPTSLPDYISGGKPLAGAETRRICRTLHGPVQARAGGIAYARRYAIWGREIETLAGLTALNEARTIRDADRAMDQVTWNENVIAVDERGNIGYWHPGLHPLRPRRWDERLPYPGTGEAEWRGFLAPNRRPQVVNPRQGFLFQWNNVPSVGWTAGDGPARERLGGSFHRARWLKLLVRRVARRPSYEASRAIDRSSGTIAQQYPFARPKLRRARRLSRGPGRAVLDALLAWDGSYARMADDGRVHEAVAIWEELKDRAEAIALGPFGGALATRLLSGEPGSSHEFDASNGEAFALRTLRPRALARAAAASHAVLAERFGTANPAGWREPRRMYDVAAQGAGATPELPFFDRGTWQQSVALGP
jgi:penicillin amidase